ncbi:uncharacterized protein PITG_06936 [Phytophthora infestans T30-4]|uniref:AAA+ ATPase domain-containing protein n=1 Tax=Phytophthora infestans (strain T30-4) TaxID=403677 RepID=D0N6U6_PHYIT|nr:uncharacterized protein PITG_06936 [Phytophthora infestans T30-4]EEY53295.1 conserved hypothetical protein [Phytophthora infestans T30-4]|eukprot:XP_002904913.1 conserved hypothetical protein [Phytophthora infestans T30-4]
MRTRAQKRQNMSELAQQLQSRLRALEAASSSAPLSPPASKKLKTDDISASPLLLTPHLPKPRTPTLSIHKTTEKPTETKSSGVQRVIPCRTLQYPEPVISKPIENPNAVLQRICSGQVLCKKRPIVGRAKEHQIVRDVLKGDAKEGGSLFIIGPPGTGKSSSVNELLIQQGYESAETTTLKRKRAVKSNKISVKLNCSTFTDPAVLFAAVMQQVKNATSWKVPERLDPLEMNRFIAMQHDGSKAKKYSIVVVLDEVDQLLRLPVRMQPTVKEVLHFFVQWAAASPHNVKFLGIMNGVDMYEQVSRVHVTSENSTDSHVPRVVFGSYTHQDLLLIMQSYPRALELVARKVAARDGDARLAISLLQQSARHALQRSSNIEKAPIVAKVMMRDVFQCVTSMLSSPIVQQIKQLPRQAKVLLYVITALAPGSTDNSGVKTLQQCDMNQVSEELGRLRSQPQTTWIPRLSREELQTHLMSLDCYALVKQGGNKNGNKASRPAAAMSVRTFWTTKLSSCVAKSEVSRALQDDTSLSQLLF